MPVPKRRIFISFDHEDTQAVNGFIGCRECVDSFDFSNHKLDHRIRSSDPNYIAQVIRDEYIKPASVAVVLIGNATANSDWVRWEVAESIRQGKGILARRDSSPGVHRGPRRQVTNRAHPVAATPRD